MKILFLQDFTTQCYVLPSSSYACYFECKKLNYGPLCSFEQWGKIRKRVQFWEAALFASKAKCMQCFWDFFQIKQPSWCWELTPRAGAESWRRELAPRAGDESWRRELTPKADPESWRRELTPRADAESWPTHNFLDYFSICSPLWVCTVKTMIVGLISLFVVLQYKYTL